MDHPYDLHKSDAALCASMARAEARRKRDLFDIIVRTLIEAECTMALPRVNGHHIHAAAERVQRLSPLFAAIDVDDCVRRLEHGYAARRAVSEVRHG